MAVRIANAFVVAPAQTIALQPAAIRQHLARVLQSPPFARAPRMQRFLAFLVEETLAGRGIQLKEYTIAVGVFGKPAEFEPTTSAIVRVEAGRLRKLLLEYAAEHGAADNLVLEVPKGSYVPAFRARGSREICTDAQGTDTPPVSRWSAPTERRYVTALSCTMTPEGQTIEGFGAQELLASFDLFHSICISVAQRHGGRVGGTASDRIIVYFGWPNALEDAAGRALTAAVDVRAEVLAAFTATSFGVRIGVATSEVVIREQLPGAVDALPTVIGEAPSLATHILTRAPLNGVLVAEATRRLTGAAFELIPAGQLENTGQPPMLLWRLLRPKRTLSRFRASHPAAEVPLVGRCEEAALIASRWRLALEGEGQGVLISGEAGIGKSSLAESVVERSASEGNLIRLQCSPHHTNSSLFPVIELIKSEVNELARDSLEVGESASVLKDYCRRHGLEEPLDTALLAVLLSRPGEESLRSISASQQKDLTLRLLARLIANQASQRATVLLIEDLHWADPTTLELVEETLRIASNMKLLVLLTSRQALVESSQQSSLTSIRLARLPKRECNELIDKMVSDTQLSAQDRILILEKADGIPLFLEELTKLVLGADESQMRESTIPASLNGLLASQLDRLGASRGIAQWAAVIGREFTAGMLAMAADVSQKDVDTALDQLIAARVIIRVGREVSNLFAFRHALLRDAAYGSLVESCRRERHSRVAGILIHAFPEIAQAHPELIARHLTDGGHTADAIPYWMDAGRKAAARYALAEAIADFRLALESIGTLPIMPANHAVRLEALTELGLVIRNARGYGDEELLEIYQQARSLAAELANQQQLANAIYGLWTQAAGNGEWRRAVKLAEEFDGLAKKAGEGQWVIEARRLLGASAALMGDFAAARRYFEEALAAYERGRHGPMFGFDPGAVSAAYLAWIMWHLGDFDAAERYATQALALADAVGHPPTLAFVLSWLIFYQVCTRDLDDIFDYGRRLQEVCAERDCRYWEPFGIACLEWARFIRDGAPCHLDTLLVAARAFHERYFTSCLLLLAADVCLTLRRPLQGLEAVSAARQFIEAHDERVWECECSRYEAELLLESERPDTGRAKRLLRQSIEVARAQGARALEQRALESLRKLRPR